MASLTIAVREKLLRTSIQLLPAHARALDAIALREGLARADIVRRAIKAYLDRHEPQP